MIPQPPAGDAAEERILHGLRRINRGVAAGCGILLGACTIFILVDIVLRRFAHSFGGTDEISGYVMAALTTWGFGYALVERAHVRIDLLRKPAPFGLRAVLDLLSMAAVASVAAMLAWYSWPVLMRSLTNEARANTALETPLVIPQALWWGGLAWFAAMSILMLLVGCVALARRRFTAVEQAIGIDDSQQQESLR